MNNEQIEKIANLSVDIIEAANRGTSPIKEITINWVEGSSNPTEVFLPTVKIIYGV